MRQTISIDGCTWNQYVRSWGDSLRLTATDLKADGAPVSLEFRKPHLPGSSVVTFSTGTLVPENGGIESNLTNDFRAWRRARWTGGVWTALFGLGVLLAGVGSGWAAHHALQAVSLQFGIDMPAALLCLGTITAGLYGAGLVAFAIFRPE